MNKFYLSILTFIVWLVFNPLAYAEEGDDSTQCPSLPTVSNNSNAWYTNGFSDGRSAGMKFCEECPQACGAISPTAKIDVRTEQEVREECRLSPLLCGITTENIDGSTKDGIVQCQNDPASCEIEVNLNDDGSTADGIAQCQNDPASCEIEVNLNTDGSTTAGVTQCQDDPASCDIEVNFNTDGSIADGIAQCQNDPASCGITVDYNTDGSTQAGIAQCQKDPLSCGIQVNPNVTKAFQEAKTQCKNNPISCGIDIKNCPVDSRQTCTPIKVHGFFSLGQGDLYLPAVDVPTAFDGTVTTYQVEMKLISGREPLSFSVEKAVPLD